MAKIVSERIVRDRVRRGILRETYRNRTIVGNSSSSSSRTPGEKSRGGSRDETPAIAMERLQDSLEAAQIGDTFYLTFTLGHKRVVTGKRAAESDPSGGVVMQHDTSVYDDVRDSVIADSHGSPGIRSAEDVRRASTLEERNTNQMLSMTTSTISAGQTMIKRGRDAMKVVLDDRKERLEELVALASKSSAEGSGITPADALDRLFGAAARTSAGPTTSLATIETTPVRTVFSFEPIFAGDSISAADREKIRQIGPDSTPADVAYVERLVASLRTRVLEGRMKLSTQEALRERKLINAALIIGTGRIMFELGKPEHGGMGISDAGKSVIEVTHPFKSTSPEGTRVARVNSRGLDELELRASGSRDSFDALQKITLPNSRMTARDIALSVLLNTAATECMFPVGADIQLPAGRAQAMLESAGLPSSLLVQSALILIGSLISVNTKSMTASKLLTGARERSNPHSPLANAAWALHFDPDHAIKLATDFGAERPEPHQVGSREFAHFDRKTSVIMRGLDIMSSRYSKNAAAVVPVVTKWIETQYPDVAKDVTPSDITQAIETQRRLRDFRSAKITQDRQTQTGKQVKGTISDYRDAVREGNRHVSVSASEINRIANNREAERLLYENYIGRIQFGVTMRCVGHDATVELTREKIDNLAQSEGAKTARKFPVFDVRAEMPRQSSKNTIKKAEDLQTMYSPTYKFGEGMGTRGSMASETAKVLDPGETTNTQRRIPGFRTQVFCSAVSLPSMASALAGSKSLSEAIRDAEANGDELVVGNFTMRYIEKSETSYYRVSSDFVAQLERTLDRNLRQLDVTVQLLSAVRTAPDTRSIESAAPLQIHTAAGLGIGVPRSTPIVEMFDVTGRSILSSEAENPLRGELISAIKRMNRDYLVSDSVAERARILSAIHSYQTLLGGSFGKRREVFESEVNAKVAGHVLRSLKHKIQTIDHGGLASMISVLQNLNFGALRQRANRIEDPETRGVAVGLANRLSNQTSPSAKNVARASLPISLAGDESVRSSDDIMGSISNMIPGRRVPSTYALPHVASLSREKCRETLNTLTSLRIDDVISTTLRGSKAFDHDENEGAEGDIASPINLMQSVDKLFSDLADIESSALRSAEILEDASDEIEKFERAIASLRSLGLVESDLLPIMQESSGEIPDSTVELIVSGVASRVKMSDADSRKVQEGMKDLREAMQAAIERVAESDAGTVLEMIDQAISSIPALYAAIDDLIETVRAEKKARAETTATGDRLQLIRRKSASMGKDASDLERAFHPYRLGAVGYINSGTAQGCVDLLRLLGEMKRDSGGMGLVEITERVRRMGEAAAALVADEVVPMYQGLAPTAMDHIRTRSALATRSARAPSGATSITSEDVTSLNLTVPQAKIIRALLSGEGLEGTTRVVNIAADARSPYVVARRIISSTASERGELSTLGRNLALALFPLTPARDLTASMELTSDPADVGMRSVGVEAVMSDMVNEISDAFEVLEGLIEEASGRRVDGEPSDEQARASAVIIALGQILGVTPSTRTVTSTVYADGETTRANRDFERASEPVAAAGEEGEAGEAEEPVVTATSSFQSKAAAMAREMSKGGIAYTGAGASMSQQLGGGIADIAARIRSLGETLATMGKGGTALLSSTVSDAMEALDATIRAPETDAETRQRSERALTSLAQIANDYVGLVGARAGSARDDQRTTAEVGTMILSRLLVSMRSMTRGPA